MPAPPRDAPDIPLPPYSYVPGHDHPHPVTDPRGHLFNEGYAWEAHEAWEHFWHALGRTTPEARFVQGLIHLAAACVKIREGKPAGVATHTKRARELLGVEEAAGVGESGVGTLGLDPASVSAVLVELERYRPECWQTSRCPVVKVLSAGLGIEG